MDPYSFIAISQGIVDTYSYYRKHKEEIVFLNAGQEIKQFIPAGRSNKCAYCGSHQDKAYRCIHCGAPMEEQLSRVTEKNLYGHSL